MKKKWKVLIFLFLLISLSCLLIVVEKLDIKKNTKVPKEIIIEKEGDSFVMTKEEQYAEEHENPKEMEALLLDNIIEQVKEVNIDETESLLLGEDPTEEELEEELNKMPSMLESIDEDKRVEEELKQKDENREQESLIEDENEAYEDLLNEKENHKIKGQE